MVRTFKLWTYDNSASFDLSSTTCFATNPKGLGNAFEITYDDSIDSKYITNIRKSFSPIIFEIVFNGSGNPYLNYNSFMTFLALNGRNILHLQYTDAMGIKFTDIVLKDAPKSEIGKDKMFKEKFTFDRIEYWYKVDNLDFRLSANEVNRMAFPLKFPLAFNGRTFTDKAIVENRFFDSIPVFVEINGGLADIVSLYIMDINSHELISEVNLNISIKTDERFILDSANKKAIFYDTSSVAVNGYSMINRATDSFLYIPRGKFVIGSNITPQDSGSIKLSIRQFIFD